MVLENIAPLAPFTELETWYGVFVALAFEKTMRRVIKSRILSMRDEDVSTETPKSQPAVANKRSAKKGKAKGE